MFIYSIFVVVLGVTDVQYSEQNLVDQLETCAEHIERSERYEILYHLYNLILPIYEKRRDYGSLSRAYSTLAQAMAKVTSMQGKRLLGRFYRVAFYGEVSRFNVNNILFYFDN